MSEIRDQKSCHPCAEIFPLMEGAHFDALTADIKAHGLREPIIELNGAILDGRNRYRACLAAGVEARYTEYRGDDPLGFVISLNLHRRHLDESQRAMVAARLANLRNGEHAKRSSANLPSLPGVRPAPPSIRQPDAAARLNVSERSVREARVVLDRGIPELAKRVEHGEVAVSVAAKIAEMPKARQHAVINDSPAQLRGTAKKEQRATREREFAETTKAAMSNLGTKLYGVIYADPPWRFEPYSRDTGMDRAADNHYGTMSLDDIKAMAVPAGKDAVLFLWATAPMLPQALSVMEAWGFAYKSHCVWRKDRAGTGYWFRNSHELLLVGTRGTVPAPAPGSQYESVISLDVGKHSAKPPGFAEMIEELFPNTQCVELFARGQRLGWDVWGNEAAVAE